MAELTAGPPWKTRALFQGLELFNTPEVWFAPKKQVFVRPEILSSAGARKGTCCAFKVRPISGCTRADGAGRHTGTAHSELISSSPRDLVASAVVKATAAVLQFLLAIKFCTEPQRQLHVLPAQMLS